MNRSGRKQDDEVPSRTNPPLFVLIHGTALISVLGVSSILPVLPEMGRFFNLSPAELGLPIISFTLPGVFLAPVGGILADRLGRKAVLLPCLLLFALGGCMSAAAQSLEQLLFWRAVQGCGAACLGVLYNTIIGDAFLSEKSRLRVMGQAAAALSLGTALYPALGGLLGEWGWRPPLLLSLSAAPLAILCAFVSFPPLHQRSAMGDYARRMRGIVLRRSSLEHFGITLCAFFVLYGPMITFFPLLAHTRFAAPPSSIGLLFAAASLGTALAAYGLGALSRICLPHLLIKCGALLFASSMLILFMAEHLKNLWAAFLPTLLYGLGQGLVYPAVMTSLSSLAPPEGRGALMAVNGTILRLSQTISPLLCGFCYSIAGFDGVYALGLCAAFVMLGLTTTAFTPAKRNAASG